MLSELYKTNTEDFFKSLTVELMKLLDCKGELVVRKHSATGLSYVAMMIFTLKDNMAKYLNIIAIDPKNIYFIEKYYKVIDWNYLSDEQRQEWRGSSLIFPLDNVMYLVTDISRISIEELSKMVSLNKNYEAIDSASPIEENVFSCIDDFYSLKQQKENIESRIKKYQEELALLQKENIVSKVIVPIASQCMELLEFDSYKLSKSKNEQGLRINIILEKKDLVKRLSLLLIDDYPTEIVGVDENKNYKYQQLPKSFKELSTHFR